ncbi:peptide/nickel transport system ATP-binding protein [Desulfonauticus submarinus]|uniref:Peptide/nickel transport system ATP-binding protein n=1 Tax=Desulfonauticus submarinus TaxID=206665 RepID=A0A1H0BDL2_9BACT|nr:ABC transporter ATP-binding protein [Desulfonauticus submarinus]SDN43744.1 peptide/nickel transport system ATP-binding protein [Desulfonauticus submarinus]
MIILRAINLSKTFSKGFLKTKKTKVINNVTFNLKKGETLALIGESGSGKTILSKLLPLLIRPTSGKIIFKNLDLTTLTYNQLHKVRQKIQLIPQTPQKSLNPKWKIKKSMLEPLKIQNLSKKEIKKNLYNTFSILQLDMEYLDRYPHELSGGQLQRIIIARSLFLSPDIIVCDEITSMLDVSIQAYIVNTLLKLQKKLKTSYVFISHDIDLVKNITDKVIVIHNGEILEQGIGILENPLHPYTLFLLGKTDILSPIKLGSNLNKADHYSTCPFITKCPVRISKCFKGEPPTIKLKQRIVRCFLF